MMQAHESQQALEQGEELNICNHWDDCCCRLHSVLCVCMIASKTYGRVIPYLATCAGIDKRESIWSQLAK